MSLAQGAVCEDAVNDGVTSRVVGSIAAATVPASRAARSSMSQLGAFASLGLQIERLSPPTSSDRKPSVGQRCSISYVGKRRAADGTLHQFDASKEPLVVRAGRGQVIPGWDVALPHIALNETVRLTIQPWLAYGSRGKPPVIPPHSTLTFEMTLNEVHDDAPSDALLEAASTGSASGVLRALRAGAAVTHADRKGATALHLAASGGHLEVLIRLIEAGAAVDAAQSQPAGVTPLMLAVKNSAEPACARLLICAKADPHRTSAKGNSAVSIAGGSGTGGSIWTSALAWQAPPHAGGGDEQALGIGHSVAPGWEALRCDALWRARARARNPRCWLRFVVAPDAGAAGAAPPAGDTEPLVVVELWADVVPKTAENFRCLCTGEKGACAAFGSPPLHYKGNAAHRIVPYQILQAGDITTGDGKGGESIYGRKFADESFDGRAGRHSSKGLLSMANSGRNSNGSQFFITLDAMPHLDGKHVVFGRVVEGMEYVEAIAGAAGAAGDATGKPTRRVVIQDCGELPPPA